MMVSKILLGYTVSLLLRWLLEVASVRVKCSVVFKETEKPIYHKE